MQAISIDVPQVGVSGSGHPHGLPLSPGLPSAGFTAVNGVPQRNASFRPDDSVQRTSTSSDVQSTIQSPSGTFYPHGWRPEHTGHSQDARSPTREDSNASKRKRSEVIEVETTDDGHPSRNFGDRNESPKRRQTGLDSAVDLTSPQNSNQTAPLSPTASHSSAGVPYSPHRTEPSPVDRWHKAEPLPKPRPEVEASLAASLHQFQQQSQHIQDTQPPRATSPHSSPSPNQADNVADSQEHSDDYNGGTSSDPKRRKRQFANRTKTGCHTCRQRKKKCGEERPNCKNCLKGNFDCMGYGPKPPGGMRPIGPATIPLLSKTPMTNSHVSANNHANNNHPLNNHSASNHPPSNHSTNNQPVHLPPANAPVKPEEGRSYSHWGRIPEPEPARQLASAPSADSRPCPTTPDTWQKPRLLPPQEPPPYQNERLPPPNFTPAPAPAPPPHPPYSHDPRHHSMPPNLPPHPPHPPYQYPPPAPMHLPPHQRPPNPLPPALPPPMEPSTQQFNPAPYLPYNGGVPSSRGSVGTSGSHGSGGGFPLLGNSYNQEKMKMLRGEPFLHYLDTQLIDDRSACEAALDAYNKAPNTTSADKLARGKLFNKILMPEKRPKGPGHNPHFGPVGSIGTHSIVQSPFTCEYGFNLHIGERVVIEAACHFQDAADIFIGNRVTIGRSVTICGMTVSPDPAHRGGSRGKLVAGAVKIEDDVFIGAGAIILPFVTVGRGATIGAGSVVTKDVERYTNVAGNPAKLIRRVGGSNPPPHHSRQMQIQEDGVRQWMRRYADENFSWYSSPPMH